ncbi:MAG: UDP-N-acetylmuramoyl-L-alanyl-D-glutamate--2,6-diaminopimelate ligase [Nostocoides sp.]
MSLPRPTPPRRTGLSELLAHLRTVPPAVIDGDPTTVVTGVSLDSRSVRDGDLFAALPGANGHGASFAAVVAGRAAALLTDTGGLARARADGVTLPALLVPAPRDVLGDLASVIYGNPSRDLDMIGITGTNGKTTTAYLIGSALGALGRSYGLIGTVETRIATDAGTQRITSVRTTPESPDLHALLGVMRERGARTCVMEVSSHALAQHRVDGVTYDVALFTNLSQDHLDFHHDMEHYFAAKASLFTPQRSRAAVICTDTPWGDRLAATAKVPVTTVGSTSAGADWQVTPDSSDPGWFTLRGPGGTLRLRAALPGEFNVMNTAMAALALMSLGVPIEDTEAAIRTDPHVPGRMEQVAGSVLAAAAPRAVVDYAHTPEAVAAALAALRPSTPGRLVVVLGAGGDRDRGKRVGMGRAAAHGADLVVVTDDNPREEDPATIRAAIMAGVLQVAPVDRVLEVPGRAEAITAAVRAAGPAGTVAVVGKGHESGQEIAGTLHPFDDRVELRRALDEVFSGGAA